MSILKRFVAILGLLFALLLALIGILSVTRGTPVSHVRAIGDPTGLPGVTDSLFARTFELYTGTHLEPGNDAEILSNGDGTYPRVWQDLRSAKQTITIQMYFAKPGAVADTFSKYLRERARARVRVLLLLDAFGAQDLRGAWADSVRAAGVEVAWLRPLRWYTLDRATHRSHSRFIIVDGRVGYTGGFGIADYWLGNGRRPDQWREANVRVTGPVVAQFQAGFAAEWAEATGELLTGDLFFPRVSFAPSGSEQAGLLHTIPTVGSTPAERFLALSITAARKTLYVANSYFVPDDDFRAMLIAAARRGVDVRILTAGEKTDIKSTLYAGRARYEQFLRAGVRVYEYQPTMMHAKTLSVDGIWSTIGSLNFDNRSLAFNDETNLVTLDAEFGARMDSLFLEDLRYSREIKLSVWLERPWTGRVLEWGANLLSRVL